MEEYLNVLSNRLTFLDNKEKEKVLKKYKDIIESKNNENKNYNEIVKDIGSIDSVVKKECKLRNINYEYYIRSNNFDKNVTNISNIASDFIKETIVAIRTVVSKNNLSSFLQCVVKIIVLILLFTLFKLPFILLRNFMYYVNNIVFYPMHGLFNDVSDVFLGLIYLLVCITWALKIFGNYKVSEKKEVNRNKIKKNVDKDYNWLNIIIRILIYLILLIPLGLLMLGSLILLSLCIYLVLIGIKIIGLSILFFSLFALFTCIFMSIKNSLNSTKEAKILPLILCILLFFVGIFTTVVDLTKFKHPDNLSESCIKSITEIKSLELNEDVDEIAVLDGDYELLKDDNLVDNQVRFEVTYYDDYVDVEYMQEKNKLIFKTILDSNIDYSNKYKSVYTDLKNGYIFNYSQLNKISIKVYVNENTLNKLKEE